MGKLNNKGFAVTTILYGLLTMVSLILFLLVGLQSFEQKSSGDFVRQITKELNACDKNGSC